MSTLRYRCVETEIGPVFLAATERGLCSLRLLLPGQEKKEVDAGIRDLEKRFPGDGPREDEKGLAALAKQVQQVITGKASAGDVPLDMPGTPFQRKVWETLLRLGWGETCSYTELARRAGLPRAIRAAASACARNPVAFVVPCHRVIASGSGLGGYYYGLPFKKQLLEREQSPRGGSRR